MKIFRPIVKLFGQALLAMFGASLVIWALLSFMPGDIAERVLQSRGVENPTPFEIQAVRDELNLDRPFVLRYIEWLGNAVRGDFSNSFQTKKPVSAEIAERLPNTILLAFVSFILAVVISLVLALSSVYFAEKIPDKLIQMLTQIGAAIPSFLLGLLLLQFFVVGFGIGRVISASSFSDVWLPAICLAIGRALDWTQILRSNLLSAMSAPFSFVAEARGATRWRILWRYALPNALLPFLAVIGIGIGSLLGGAAIVETVFSWNGIGAMAIQAVTARDFPLVQGFVILATLIYVSVSFLIEILSLAIDPRLRES